MIKVKRLRENPILVPYEKNNWETEAAFNGCPVVGDDYIYLVYRAISSSQVSSIGCAESRNGIHFSNRRQLIKPEYEWERFGCEDPKVTKLDDKYFIFYTALSTYPFSPPGIKIGVAITTDFKTIKEKHPVTFFNSKAMALFPRKINGRLAAVLTVHTDQPPAKIGIVFFDREEQIWSREYWQNWYSSLDTRVIPLLRTPNDHIEVGAPPLETKDGWLLIYSYIENYFTPSRVFGIEAVLLDAHNPLKVIGRTKQPILVPQEEYELFGKVPNLIFPSGALVQNGDLFIYYGAADTTCCLAMCKLKDLTRQIISSGKKIITLVRFEDNPIIQPKPEHIWESKATFNPAAVWEAGKVHLVYRAMSSDDTSVLGYASSADGFHIDERLTEPIYVPRAEFEKKARAGNSGCEDPRITKIGDRFYMFYTACNGMYPTYVALTSIGVADFVDKKWNWTEPAIISPPGADDKNACLLPEKINGKYVVFHRLGHCIWIDFVDDLVWGENKWLGGKILLSPRRRQWDSRKIGIGPPPIKTTKGWLAIYHGLSRQDDQYRLGAILLDLGHPDKVLARLSYPLLEPETDYENQGLRPKTVFVCGAVVIKDSLFVYYGAADKVIGVATVDFKKLLEEWR